MQLLVVEAFNKQLHLTVLGDQQNDPVPLVVNPDGHDQVSKLERHSEY